MGVNVVNLAWIDSAIFECELHAKNRSSAITCWCRDVKCVISKAVSQYLCVDFGSTVQCMCFGFQYQNSRTFAGYKTISVVVEGTTGCFWDIVTGR